MTENELLEMTPLEVVEKLNELLFIDNSEDEISFKYSTDGNVDVIYIDDTMLWCSETDERNFIDEQNDYEPLLPHIILLFDNYVKKLSSFKLII